MRHRSPVTQLGTDALFGKWRLDLAAPTRQHGSSLSKGTNDSVTTDPFRWMRSSLVSLALAVSTGCATQDRARPGTPSGSEPTAVSRAARPVDAAAEPRTAVLQVGSTLNEFVAVGLERHPSLQASREDALAARERTHQVGAFPDPRLSFRHFIDEVETRVGPQRQVYGLSWTLPWAGKRGLRRDVAALEADAADHRSQTAAAMVTGEIRRTYFEALYLGRAIEVIQRTTELANELEGVARARYSAGDGAHPDIIRAQLELETLADQLQSLEDRKLAVKARLIAALGLPADHPLPWPESVPVFEELPSDEDFLRRIRSQNPGLRELEKQIERDGQKVELARKDPFPDVTVGLDYIDVGSARVGDPSDSGQDALAVSLSLGIPLSRGRYSASLREARARYRATRLRRQQAELGLESLAREVLYQAKDAHRRMELYGETLIPKARESLSATKTAFRGGKSSFLELVEAERLLLEFELARERAFADYGKEWATIQELTSLVETDWEGSEP